MPYTALTTFLILKDEGRTVSRALDSALGITGQFVIGIDDKSSDDTEEVVRRYAEEHPGIDWDIFTFTWENHFARARNRAIERCRGDWILQLDGHEYLRSGSAEMVRWYAQNSSPEIWLISVMMHLEPDRYGIPEIFFVQHHLWRNGRGIRYVNASHNAIPLEIVPDGRRLRTNDIVIVHQRPEDNATSRRRQRKEMNIPNFEATLDELPDDPRSLFYMAQSWVDCGRPAEAIPFYRRYLEVSEHHEERYEAAIKLGEIQALEGDPEGAGESFRLALRIMPTRAEAPFNLGLLAKARIDDLNAELLEADGTISDQANRQLYLNRLHAIIEEADRWFSIAGSTTPPVTSYFLRGRIYTYLPHLERARLAAALYRYTDLEIHLARARECFKRALEFRPGDPDTLAELRSLEDHHVSRTAATLPPPSDGRPRMLVVDATGQFTPPLIERWRGSFDVRSLRRAELRDLLWADSVFVEWCASNVIEISKRRLDAAVINRLWRYEAYSTNPARVGWRNIDALVVPAAFIKTWLSDRFEIAAPIHVVPPGIDLDRYSFRGRGPGPNVALVGFLNARKNLDEVADIVAANPIRLHIAGRWQDACLERHFWWKLRRLGCADRVSFHGWQGDVDAWLDSVDANYLLSASWSESFGFVIAEAMAKGIRPIVKHFEGAEELWSAELLYDHPGEIAGHLAADYDSHSAREWVGERYDLERECEAYLGLMNLAQAL